MLNEATSRFEHAVLAPLVVLNGGALVAFLTLFGALLGKDSGKRPVIGVAAAAIVVWAVGLVAAAFAVRCASVRQTKISASQRVMREALEDVLYPEAFAMLLAGPVPEGGEPRLSAGHDAKPMRTAAQGVVQIRGRTGRVLPPG